MCALQNDRGFSLIEVLIATLVLATGALSMAGLATISAASTREARTSTAASILALDKLEQLRSLTWAFDASGARLSDPLLATSPVDSLDRNCAGFVDFLDLAGRWLGGGTTPPPTAAFVRRWRIAPLAANPTDTVVLQVAVTPVGHPRTSQDVLLTDIRTRSVR
jgi:prepilin-type N-terminal cleavage/methylation domain-containing protein